MSTGPEDEIGQTFDQAIRTAIMTGSQAVQVAAQRQQTRTMNAHRDQQAAESAQREARQRQERYRDEQISVIYSKVNQRNFWSQNELGRVVDYTAYVAEHRNVSPRAQDAFETLSKGLKQRYGVDPERVMAFDQLKFRNALANAIDDALADQRENAIDPVALGLKRLGADDRPAAVQAQAEEVQRYVEALNEHLGDRTPGLLKEAAWPALVDELRAAEVAGHDVSSLVREITSEYGRDLDDARDNAAVLKHRAAHRAAERTPERTAEQVAEQVAEQAAEHTPDANAAPASAAAAEQAEPVWTVFDGAGSDGWGTAKITRDEVLTRIGDADVTETTWAETVRRFAGKDAAVDWVISVNFPHLMSDQQHAALADHLSRESPADRAVRLQAATAVARIQAEEQWWAGLTPDERQAQTVNPENPLGSDRKPIEWDSPEWRERVDTVLESYGVDLAQVEAGVLNRADTANENTGDRAARDELWQQDRARRQAILNEDRARREAAWNGQPYDGPAVAPGDAVPAPPAPTDGAATPKDVAFEAARAERETTFQEGRARQEVAFEKAMAGRTGNGPAATPGGAPGTELVVAATAPPLPEAAATALAESRVAFPKEVPAELGTWQKGRTSGPPKRARQNHVSTGQDTGREIER